jgi:hypothetical protein
MSNLNEIKNYQLTGSKAKKVYSAFETISTNLKLVEGMYNKLAYTLLAQKYPEISDSTKTIKELTKLSIESETIIDRLVYSMALNPLLIKDLQVPKMTHGKTEKQNKAEVDKLTTNFEQLYLKLVTYDVDLNNLIESESEKLTVKAKTIRKENDSAEEEILTIACETFGFSYETLTISDMDQLLANLEKANVWGFDFFTKRLEANQKANKPAKAVK